MLLVHVMLYLSYCQMSPDLSTKKATIKLFIYFLFLFFSFFLSYICHTINVYEWRYIMHDCSFNSLNMESNRETGNCKLKKRGGGEKRENNLPFVSCQLPSECSSSLYLFLHIRNIHFISFCVRHHSHAVVCIL